jgi:hypothetical protein
MSIGPIGELPKIGREAEALPWVAQALEIGKRTGFECSVTSGVRAG